MKPEYQEYLDGLRRFNDWETRRRRQLTITEKLDQFRALFELNDLVPAEIQKKMHTEHLAALCRLSALLKAVHESH